MIFGIGIDLLNIDRLEKLYLKFQEKLFDKILSNSEKEILVNKNDKLNFLAKRFSVKESFVKAVGFGFGKNIGLTDINVINNLNGKPEIFLSEKAKVFLSGYFLVDFNDIKINVSITDEKPYINTIVIISKNEDNLCFIN